MSARGTGSLRSARRLILLGLGGLVLAAVAVAVAVLAAPQPTRANPGLCVDVAQARGLGYRGVYGTTPWAINPMSAVMLRNMGNGAAVADVAATAT